MPSGSKKRKAAKKKKENQSNNHPNPSSASTNAHGGDDVKNQDDKESDVGEVSSPASQVHHSHQNILTEGEEEEIEEGDNISNPPSVEGVNIEVADEPNIVVEETVVPVERKYKIEDESDKKDGRFEHDDTARKSYNGGSSGSSSNSSSSSDDESHSIKSGQAVDDIAPVVDSVKVADSVSGGQAEAIHSTTIEEAGDAVVENFPAAISVDFSLLGEKAEVDMSSPAINSAAPSTNLLKMQHHSGRKQLFHLLRTLLQFPI
ncbi:hypothetical protein Pfo_023448 [Paulownia fortunei]|nr:hypothetical protein Pfo_023448 [Paulownia fortunei]